MARSPGRRKLAWVPSALVSVVPSVVCDTAQLLSVGAHSSPRRDANAVRGLQLSVPVCIGQVCESFLTSRACANTVPGVVCRSGLDRRIFRQRQTLLRSNKEQALASLGNAVRRCVQHFPRKAHSVPGRIERRHQFLKQGAVVADRKPFDILKNERLCIKLDNRSYKLQDQRVPRII